jgi:RNA-directed DNA polymerase
VEKKMTEAPEPKDKLDAATAMVDVVNGPEDAILDWHAVDWRACEENVRRLRQRIFTASRAGNLQRVRSLQKLMLRSRSNTLISVRRVTERNAGRLTAGVDGEVALSPEAKIKLAARVHDPTESFKALPVRRVYIPKPGGKRRPLGIPVIIDRVHQARVVNALEPEWEARFEPRSYGFRPGRGCHDAIEAVFTVTKGASPRRLWALDADLAGAFDRIAHDHILTMLGTFPARGMVRQWLRAGVVENGRLHRTEEGTPQGGVVSPALLNIALHGMETAAGVRYHTTGVHAGGVVPGCPALIRYADDFVALCHSRQEALEVKARLAAWLVPRGLAFNEDKTRVVTLQDGLDFLGFNVRRYDGKLLIKPSKAAVRRIRERLRTELRSLRGTNAEAVIKRLNPIIRGWAAYYRTQVSSETFDALDHYLWKLTYRWAIRSHRNKPTRWVTARYFGKFNKARQNRWVFGDRNSGAYMHQFSWTNIVRHQLVRQGASPDDPALTEYWAWRRRKATLPTSNTRQRLYRAQDGRCQVCKATLDAADHRPQTPREWEHWLASTRNTITITLREPGTPDMADHRLTHSHCHHGNGPVLLPPREPSGLARAGCRETGTSGS